MLNTISGILRPREGLVCFERQEIHDVPLQAIVCKGVIQVPEGCKVFSRMTVAENLEMGAYTQSHRATVSRDMEAVFERFSHLRDRRNQLAGTLSGGEQQMLAIWHIPSCCSWMSLRWAFHRSW